jgi:pimeloyl-ACP methyl ester carboxylesterase
MQDPSQTTERLNLGKVFILPGIEGTSYWNRSTRQGLLEAGVPYALEIFEWTTGWRPLSLYHLRSRKLHQSSSSRLVDRIAAYREEYPNRPVYLVGHSGGAGLSMLTLSRLPAELTVTGAVLLSAAISPYYDAVSALQRTQRGIWNFRSWGDFFFLGLGTSVMGTIDGRHTPSAGMIGFSEEIHRAVQQAQLPPLREMPYRWEYVKHFHFSGHFGYVLSPFAKSVIAPILCESLPSTAPQSTRSAIETAASETSQLATSALCEIVG